MAGKRPSKLHVINLPARGEAPTSIRVELQQNGRTRIRAGLRPDLIRDAYQVMDRLEAGKAAQRRVKDFIRDNATKARKRTPGEERGLVVAAREYRDRHPGCKFSAIAVSLHLDHGGGRNLRTFAKEIARKIDSEKY